MIMESYYDGGGEREFRAQCERRKRMYLPFIVNDKINFTQSYKEILIAH